MLARVALSCCTGTGDGTVVGTLEQSAIRNRGVVVVQEDFDIFIETIAGLRILCAQQEEGPTTTAAPAEAPEPEPEA
jgi:hypothetical protein